jgi:hypothetical protein
MDKKEGPAATAGSKTEHNPIDLSIPQLERFERAYMENYRLSLFPVKERDKIPMTPNGFKDATNDLDQYRKLHEGRPHNIGMPTGPVNGLFVLDVDPRHGGHDTLRALLLEYGPMVPTWQALTQSGGAHYFFKWDDNQPVGNRANILPGLDIRGVGGYVLIAPSVVEGSYDWVRSPSKTELMPAPEWLMQLLQTPEVPAGAKDLSHLGEGLQDGRRNVGMTELLGTLLGRGVDIHLAWALADSYNRCYVNPPIEERELLKTFQSIAKREISKRERRQRKWGA